MCKQLEKMVQKYSEKGLFMIEKKYEHAGHRKRMKDKYIEYGIEIFSPHEVLEVLLYYAIPRKDTNSTAHKLIDEFGSISAVIDAPYESLDARQQIWLLSWSRSLLRAYCPVYPDLPACF